MSITFELDMEAYERLLSRCDHSSAEYHALLTGCIEERTINRRYRLQKVVQILCEDGQAELIFNLALSACPEAADIIKNTLKEQ
jgi:hypothetical protein